MKLLELFFWIEGVNDNFIKCKCFSCKKIYSNKIDEKLKKRFRNTFKFSNNGINKIVLLLRKRVDLYKYMNDWEKFKEITLNEIEDVIDADDIQMKEFVKT